MAVRRSREEWKTYANVFDQFTNVNLQKLISGKHFDELTGTVALGKEANVFTAKKGEDKVAVKIYRLENCNFNKMYTYISDDVRYADLKGQKRKIIFAWTQREFRNLMIAREVIRVPTPIVFRDNILVTEFIDEDGFPASQLKNVEIENVEELFNQIISDVGKLYKKGLVHGDLSEFNILMQRGKPVYIDFSQGTSTNSSNSRELLERDIGNLLRFFKKRGFSFDAQQYLKTITSS